MAFNVRSLFIALSALGLALLPRAANAVMAPETYILIFLDTTTDTLVFLPVDEGKLMAEFLTDVDGSLVLMGDYKTLPRPTTTTVQLVAPPEPIACKRPPTAPSIGPVINKVCWAAIAVDSGLNGLAGGMLEYNTTVNGKPILRGPDGKPYIQGGDSSDVANAITTGLGHAAITPVKPLIQGVANFPTQEELGYNVSSIGSKF